MMLHRLGAVVVMAFGTTLVLGGVMVMNRAEFVPPEPEISKAVDMTRAPKKKPKKKKKQRQTKVQKKMTTAPPPPSPTLMTGLSGLDVGLGNAAIAMDDSSAALFGNVKASVMTEDSVDVPPKAQRRVSAKYPPRARAKSVTGFVTFRILVNEQGRVERHKVVDAKPRGVFEESATEALRQWSFAPATYKGSPVKVWVKQTVRFDLR